MSDENDQRDESPGWGSAFLGAIAILLMNLQAAEVIDVGGEGLKGPVAALVGIISFLLLGVAVVYAFSSHTGPYFAFIMGLYLWAMMPAVLGLSLESDVTASRDWWSTGWYWAVGPLPVDFATPTGWEPAITDAGGAGQTAFILVQFTTAYVVVAGLALAVGAWRRRSSPADSPSNRSQVAATPTRHE